MKLILSLIALVASCSIVFGQDTVSRVRYVNRSVQECYIDPATGQQKCRTVLKTEAVVVQEPVVLKTVAAVAMTPVRAVVAVGQHVHRRLDGTVFVHGDENRGNAAAHVGVAWPWTKISTADPQPIMSSSYSVSSYSTSNAPLMSIAARIQAREFRPLSRVAGTVRTFLSRFRLRGLSDY